MVIHQGGDDVFKRLAVQGIAGGLVHAPAQDDCAPRSSLRVENLFGRRAITAGLNSAPERATWLGVSTTVVPSLVFLAPLFLVLESWQLVMSERLLGVKQIAAGGDPRARGPGERTAAAWSVCLIVYWAWMGAMLVPGFGRAQIVCLLIVSFLGYALRRSAPVKWVLVILTLEGAIRMGMLVSLLGMAWRRLHLG